MSSKKGGELVIVNPGDFAIAQFGAEQTAAIVKENLGGQTLSATDLIRVKMPSGGGTFFDVAGDPMKELQGVIVHHHMHRAYWEKGLDEGGGNMPPDCASRDGKTGVVNPASVAADRGQGGNCATCPLAQYDSGKGGRQACKAMERLYILPPDKLLPVYSDLPPTSLKPWKGFMVRLTSDALPYYHAQVVIGLEADKNDDNIAYSKATFKSAGALDQGAKDMINAYRAAMLPALTAVEITYASED